MGKISVNICLLGGNLTRDPDLRYTPKGTPVCEFGLAINRAWNNDAGEKQEEVSFFNCASFGRTAETIAQYFRKGGSILLHARLKQETWEDRSEPGKKRSAVKVIVERFMFAGDSGGGGEVQQRPVPGPQGAATASEGAEPAQGGHGEDSEDDVPF